MTVPDKHALGWPLIAGALFGLTGVMAGAFGAHGLRGQISERGLEVFQTAVTYQMYHSIMLVLVTVLAGVGLKRSLLVLAGGFFTGGVLLFSGSLYLLVLTDMRWLGPVTPIGGLSLMLGWLILLVAGLKRKTFE